MTEAESLDLLRQEMDKQGVTNNELRAGTAAIAMGESALNPHTETSYAHTDNSRIRQVFGSRVASMSDSSLSSLKADPEQFFEAVYGGAWGVKNLGNTLRGDGYKFRGRTVLQCTGRANYTKMKEMTGYDVISNPDLANEPHVSAAIAVAYMRWRYHGGGWESMKAAVGNNTPDIAARKDRFFERFTRSGEMNVGTAPRPPAVPPAGPSGGAGDAVAEFQSAVRKIQTFLNDKQMYARVTDDNVDGDFGEASRRALQRYLDQR